MKDQKTKSHPKEAIPNHSSMDQAVSKQLKDQSLDTDDAKAPFAWFWQRLDEYLAHHQLKQTKQRRIIIEQFLRLDNHVAAEDLLDSLRASGINIGLATIYRTLNLLAEAKLVEQKSFGEGCFIYEVRMPGKHHDHLICIDCGAVFEFENSQIEDQQDKIASQHDMHLASHRLDLYGRCTRKNCDRQPTEGRRRRIKADL